MRRAAICERPTGHPPEDAVKRVSSSPLGESAPKPRAHRHTGDDRVAVERNRHAYEHLIDRRRIDAQLDVIRDRICDAVSLIVIGTVPRCSMNRQELASVLRLRMIGSRSDARAEVVADDLANSACTGDSSLAAPVHD